MAHTYSRHTLETTRLLGLEVARARRTRHWTSADLSERAGISRTTLHKIENGDPTVGIGLAFEVATLAGVPIFAADDELSSMVERSTDRLALLPNRIREPADTVHDDF